MDMTSAMLLVATQRTDPDFTKKISKHIDNYGTIDVENGRILNGRYYRLFLLNQMNAQTHPKWRDKTEECVFIRTTVAGMIDTEISCELSYRKPSDKYLKFYTGAQAIKYALQSAMNTNNRQDRKHARRVRKMLNYLNDQIDVPSDLYYIGQNGIVRSL